MPSPCLDDIPARRMTAPGKWGNSLFIGLTVLHYIKQSLPYFRIFSIRA
jgi:hypothetical protein